MTEIRQFGPATSHLLKRVGTRGLSAAVIQLPVSMLAQVGREKLAERYGGLPVLLDQPTAVVALTFAPQGEMDEHDAEHDILFIVVGGSGFVRVGGPTAATLAVKAGDAIHWPPHVLHKAWTTDDAMQAISIEYTA